MNSSPSTLLSIIAILIVALILATLLYAIASYSFLRLRENRELKKIKHNPNSTPLTTEQYVLSEAQAPESHLANTAFSENPYTAPVDVPIFETTSETLVETPNPTNDFIPAPIITQDLSAKDEEVPVILVNSKNPPPLPQLDSIMLQEVSPHLPKMEKTGFLKETHITAQTHPPAVADEVLPVIESSITTHVEPQLPVDPMPLDGITTEPTDFLQFDVPSIDAVSHPIEVVVTEEQLGSARDVKVVNTNTLEVPSAEIPKIVVETPENNIPVSQLSELTAVEVPPIVAQPPQETHPLINTPGIEEITLEEPASQIAQPFVDAPSQAVEVVPETPIQTTAVPIQEEIVAPRKSRFSLVSIDLADVKKGQGIPSSPKTETVISEQPITEVLETAIETETEKTQEVLSEATEKITPVKQNIFTTPAVNPPAPANQKAEWA